MTAKLRRHSRDRSMSRPDCNQLETFLKVVEHGSFAAAARELGVSQPAVSQMIAKLEAIYGADLFERGRRIPVTLTPVGRAILPTAKLLLFMVDTQITRAVETAQSSRGTLTIGFHSGLSRGPLHAAIAEFSRKQPSVTIKLVEAPVGSLLRRLNERVIDIVFAALLPEVDGGHNSQENLWREPLVVAMPESHPLCQMAKLGLLEVSQLPIILRSNNGDLTVYRAIAALMKGQVLNCNLHDVSRGSLIEMVRLGLGATILYSSAAFSRSGVAIRPIMDDNASVAVRALWPKGDRNPLRHSFLACVRKHATDAFVDFEKPID